MNATTENRISAISIISLGFLLGFFLPDKEKTQLKIKNQESKIQLEEAQLITEKLQEQNKKPGGFVLLNKKITLIKFENFEGEVTWYRAYDLEKLKSEYSSINFHPIKTEEIVNGKNITIPDNACAFLLKSTAQKNNYSVVYSYE